MVGIEKDLEREERITMEIIVDAYSPEEQAMGWYYYLEEKMEFPFAAVCISQRRISPLKKGTSVNVIGMAVEEECNREMFVEIDWEEESLAVPLSQLEAVEAIDETKEAMADWHYWVNQGYDFES